MKLSASFATAISLLVGDASVNAFTASQYSAAVKTIPTNGQLSRMHLSMATEAEVEVEVEVEVETIEISDYTSVNSLTYRQLQKECKKRSLAANGNTAALRDRLLKDLGLLIVDEECDVDNDENCDFDDIVFTDESDPDFDFNALTAEIEERASVGHWKAATRKLKKLNKRFATAERPVTVETYTNVLEACTDNRLQGARASEPARKILEQMAQEGYEIPAHLGNQCVISAIGKGPNGTHDGCGGIDTALAMLAAMETSPSGSAMITVDTYGAVVSALSIDGAVEEACLLLRAMVVEHSFTPPLSVFADVARSASKAGEMGETVLQVMTLAKASGYILDNIASASAGRDLIASGVIASEQMDNLPLGLRLLTAAAKAEGCAPDRGDDLVASSSSAAQRACTLIHRRAIDTAIGDNNWKLAVRLERLMVERSLTPSTVVLRKVVGVCTRNEKSRKATELLLDWTERAEEGKAENPPISVFNEVLNACEICGEEELTLDVLEAMKKVHESEGNIVTLNIALKRLAKQGNLLAVEGLIIGMLQAGLEPNVVTYTTAIGACVKAEDSAMAAEWLRRMRSRLVMPNYHTYNTALAACLDGKLESTMRASTIAKEMMDAVSDELATGVQGNAEFTSVMPDQYTKVLSISLMKQLRQHWRDDEINMKVAKTTVRVPMLRLLDFDKKEAKTAVQEQKEAVAKALSEMGEEAQIDGLALNQDLADVVAMAKAHRTMEV